MTAEDRRSLMSTEFFERFGLGPKLWARAPGRVDLMGSHTDYNEGYVLTMTIDRDTWIAAMPRQDRVVEIYSLNMDGGGAFSLDEVVHDRQFPWTDYVRGVAAAIQNAGHELRGFNALIHSTIPFGSGLSSSAAIEMAAAEIFQMCGGFKLEKLNQAILGQNAENRFVGVNSGILDQYSSVFGEEGCALLLDCRHLNSKTMRLAGDLGVVICDTRSERQLVGSEYDDRRAECDEGVRILQRFYPDIRSLRDVSLTQFEAHASDIPETAQRRCRFIIQENERVLALAQALPKGDRSILNTLLAGSYKGARDLFEIVSPAMEAMMEAVMASPGIVGARQAGAGFGGCMVALVDVEQISAFADHAAHAYDALAGITPFIYQITPSTGSGPILFRNWF